MCNSATDTSIFYCKCEPENLVHMAFRLKLKTTTTRGLMEEIERLQNENTNLKDKTSSLNDVVKDYRRMLDELGE